MNGVSILIVILVFFALIYLYAYWTTDYKDIRIEKRRLRKIKKTEQKEAKLKLEIEERLKNSVKDYQRTNSRAEEIKKEIARLDAQKKSKPKKDNHYA